MIGIFATCVHIGVAAVAAANAAFKMASRLAPATRRLEAPDVGARTVHCMALLLVGLHLSGSQFTSFCDDYDAAFNVIIPVVYYGGLTVAAIQVADNIADRFNWAFVWKESADSVRLISFAGLVPLLVLAVFWPTPSSWCPFLLSILTLVHFMFASLASRSRAQHMAGLAARARCKANTRTLAVSGLALALGWGACGAINTTRGLRDHWDEKELRVEIAILAAFQAATLFAIAWLVWRGAKETSKTKQPV
jgi:hypothetical protein